MRSMKTKIVYFGSGAFGVPTLGRLARDHELCMVVTQPDRPAGRGGKLTPTPVGEWCAANTPGVPILKPENVNDAEVCARIAAERAGAFVVIAFGQKLGRPILEGVFAINLHASLLPRWRGAAPINAAMLGGDTVTGNSVITLADRMDAGLVLGQTTRKIDPHMTAGELHDLLSEDGPDLVSDVLSRHLGGTLSGVAQDPAKVTQAKKLSRADAWVDFSASAEDCRRRIHGLTPWPSVHAKIRAGGSAGHMAELKLLRVQAMAAAAEQGSTAVAGTLHAEPDRGEVVCGGGTALRLVEVQPAGKRPMSWDQYARGLRMEGALSIASDPSPPSAQPLPPPPLREARA